MSDFVHSAFTLHSIFLLGPGKQGSRCVGLVQAKSHGRVINKEESERAYQMAVEASSESSFISVMNASNVFRGYYVVIICFSCLRAVIFYIQCLAVRNV